MMPETKETTQKNQLFAFAIIFAALVMLLLIWMQGCHKQRPQLASNDSLIWANSILSKQYGMMSAEAQAQGLRAARAEQMARERDTIYISRTKIIIKQAPDTCQPYLLAMGQECDTLVLAHVNSELAKDTLIDLQSGIIANRNDVIHNDSIVKIDLNKQLVNSDKKLKMAKIGNKILTGLAIGFAAVVTYTTIFK